MKIYFYSLNFFFDCSNVFVLSCGFGAFLSVLIKNFNMKKIVQIFLFWVIFLSQLWNTFAQQAPGVVCYGLPGCNTNTVTVDYDRMNSGDNVIFTFLWNVISEWITYVSVIAVLSLMVWGVMFILAAWEEEKITKARKWIIWSLVGVLLSISAWWIINLLNTFKIN